MLKKKKNGDNCFITCFQSSLSPTLNLMNLSFTSLIPHHTYGDVRDSTTGILDYILHFKKRERKKTQLLAQTPRQGQIKATMRKRSVAT